MDKRSPAKSLADRLFPMEKEEDVPVINIPPEKRRLHTETYDFSVATIYDYMNKGNIFLPQFQRGYVWKRPQASRLIESLIIQCPIPVIYLHQEQDERLAVIDGNQRLQSIRLFLEDGFELSGLTAYPELTGLHFSQLDPRFKRHIYNRTLRCITILKETHPQIKFDVFERINTGAVQLNPQETRHGVYHGNLIELIDELSAEPIWKKLSGIKNDTRMRGAELILRFIALYSNLENYSKPLSSFLNNFCENNSKASSDQLLEWKKIFLTALGNINILFGEIAFRVIDKDLKPLVRNFNAALFDAQMVSIAKLNPDSRNLRRINRQRFLNSFYNLIQENEFKASIEAGTSAGTLVQYRIRRFRTFLEEELKG